MRVVPGFRTRLGEGTHWDVRRQRLWLVDIRRGNVHWFDPHNAVLGTRHVGSMVGWVIPVSDSEHLLLGLRDGVAVLDFSNTAAAPHLLFTDRRYPPAGELRLNDAKIDAHGRLWCGCVSAENESRSIASLARIDLSSGRVEIVDEGYQVANGPAFSPDGAFMLHSDSARRVVYRFDLDPSSGEILGKRIWKTFTEEDGHPDGMNFDAAGNVWIAFWGVGKVGCFTPLGLRRLDLDLPAQFVTSVCFGGPRLDHLYVTSASPDNDDQPSSGHPLAGALFEVSNIAAFGLPCREATL
jgi:D-xylonolactonase